MDILFENHHKRTKEFHKEITACSFFKNPLLLATYSILALIFGFSVLSILAPGVFPFGSNASVRVFVTLALLVTMIVRYTRYSEISYKRDLETNNGEPLEIKTILTNDGVDVYRMISETPNHISYKSVRKLISTKNYFILLTEAKQYIVFKKDGFVQGSPDEFLSFVKSKIVKDKKRSRLKVVIICLVSVLIAVMYWTNGRTVFEDRRKPSDKEMETINIILAYEQSKLSECIALMAPFQDRIKELGVEVKPELRRTRSVNSNGRVENHDWNKDMWLPKFYGSQIVCTIYKDGEKLEHQISTSSRIYFVTIHWLLHAGKKTDIIFNKEPLISFDVSFNRLLDDVARFLEK